MKNPLRTCAGVFALCLPLLALAQTPSKGSFAAGQSAPQLRYQSAFDNYKPWQDIKPADWRAANDTVREAAASGGGHAGHGAVPAPAAASAAGGQGMPMRDHGGHHAAGRTK